MNLKNGILVSLGVHVVILLLIFFRPTLNCPCQPGTLDNVNKLNNIPIEQVILENTKGEEKADSQLDGGYLPQNGTDCGEDDWYGGIGVEHNEDGLVTKTPKSYPAYQSGIRVGDIIRNIYDLRGLVNMDVKVFILRNSNELSIEVTRTKICVKNLEKK